MSTAEIVSMFRCPIDGCVYDTKEEAERCCPTGVSIDEKFACTICDELHSDRSEALDCCRSEAEVGYSCPECEDYFGPDQGDKEDAQDCCRYPDRRRGYKCAECDEEYEDRWEAARCCPRDVGTAVLYKCPRCRDTYSAYDAAQNCCG